MKDSFYLSRKLTSIFVLTAFLINIITPAGAQILPFPGTPVTMSAGFQPPVLLGLKIHPENPLLFDFIVDQGVSQLSDEAFKLETEKLVKYFLAALTIPDKEVWVNLSPYEKDRIIPNVLGQTIMGKTMLEQDYMLKQLASSLTNPEEKLGQEFWTKVRAQGGNENLEASTLSKVWIVPSKAEVLESQGIVLIGEKRLKVMMDEEYENGGKNPAISKGSEIFRSTILPNIEKEINEGKNFADVRQIYNSVILAAWYKQALKESLLGQVYTDKGKVAGVETDDKEMKQRIYEQYIEAFKKGAYNLIKEETDSSTGDMIPRKYFSGGLSLMPKVASTSVSIGEMESRLGVSSALKRAEVRMAEPRTTEEAVLASSSVQEGTLQIPRGNAGGADTIAILLQILAQDKVTADQLQFFIDRVKANVIATGKEYDEASIFTEINTINLSGRTRILPTDEVGITRIADVNSALTQWWDKVDTDHPQHFGGGSMPLLLDAVVKELRNPQGLRAHYLENSTRLMIALNGPSLTEIIAGNTKLNVEYANGQITVSEGDILYKASGEETVGDGQLVAVGRDPIPQADEKKFRLKKAGVQVSQTHFRIKLLTLNGQQYLAIADGDAEKSSANGTIVLNTGIPTTSFRVLPAPPRPIVTKIVPKTIQLGFSTGTYRVSGTFLSTNNDNLVRVNAGITDFNIGVTSDGRLWVQITPNSPEWFNDREVRYLDFGTTYVVSRFDAKVPADPDIKNNLQFKVAARSGVSRNQHFEFSVIPDGRGYKFDLSDKKSNYETNVTWNDVQASSAVTEATGNDPFLNMQMEVEDPRQAEIDQINQALVELGNIVPATLREHLDAYQDSLAYLIEANNIFANIEITKLNTIVRKFAAFGQAQWRSDEFKLWIQNNRVPYPGEFMYLAVPAATWTSQQQKDYMSTPGYAKDGFIRFASHPDTVVAQANRLSTDVGDVVVLKINKVVATQGGPIDINIGEENTPRLYNVMSTKAVVETIPLNRNDQGVLEMRADILKRERSVASSAANEAVVASAPAVEAKSFTKGGIDFDPTNMNLQIKRDGKGVPLPLPQQNLQQINIEGLVPVIINVVPINPQTLPIFLGQAPKEPAREPELAVNTAS